MGSVSNKSVPRIRLTSIFTTSGLPLNSILAIALEGFKKSPESVCLLRPEVSLYLRTPCKLPFLRNAQYNVKLAWRLMRLHMFISSWANINEVIFVDSVSCRLDIYNIDPSLCSQIANLKKYVVHDFTIFSPNFFGWLFQDHVVVVINYIFIHLLKCCTYSSWVGLDSQLSHLAKSI